MLALPNIPVRGDFAITWVLEVADAHVAVRIPPLIIRAFPGPNGSHPFWV
jgi:hypothetical protein